MGFQVQRRDVMSFYPGEVLRVPVSSVISHSEMLSVRLLLRIPQLQKIVKHLQDSQENTLPLLVLRALSSWHSPSNALPLLVLKALSSWHSPSSTKLV